MNMNLALLLLSVVFASGCGAEEEAAPVASDPAKGVAAGGSPTHVENRSAGPIALGDFVSFPDVGMKMRKPEGFEVADTFTGFGHRETQSSVIIMKTPESFHKVTRDFTHVRMLHKGWKMLSSTRKLAGRNSEILVNFEQPVEGAIMHKWVRAIGSRSGTTLVMATMPKSEVGRFGAPLKEVIQTAGSDGEAGSPEPTSQLPFDITISKKLKRAPISIGPMLMCTSDGALQASSPEQPLFLATMTARKIGKDDQKDYAETHLRTGTAQIKSATIESTTAVSIDGLDGFESVAKAQDEKSGIPLRIYQAIVFEEQRYFLIQGLVGEELAEQYLPEFQAMARSLKRK